MYRTTKEEQWKKMALTSKDSFKATIPKRQFIGPSAFLMKRLEKNHEHTVNKIIEKYFK